MVSLKHRFLSERQKASPYFVLLLPLPHIPYFFFKTSSQKLLSAFSISLAALSFSLRSCSASHFPYLSSTDCSFRDEQDTTRKKMKPIFKTFIIVRYYWFLIPSRPSHLQGIRHKASANLIFITKHQFISFLTLLFHLCNKFSVVRQVQPVQYQQAVVKLTQLPVNIRLHQPLHKIGVAFI